MKKQKRKRKNNKDSVSVLDVYLIEFLVDEFKTQLPL